MATETLSFYTLGPEFTTLLRNFIHEGSYKTAYDVLSDGLNDDQVRTFFLGGYKFEGDSRDEEGLSVVPDTMYSEDEFAERCFTGIRTILSLEDMDFSEIFTINIDSYPFEDERASENLKTLFKVIPLKMLQSLLAVPIIKYYGYKVVAEIDSSSFDGVILNDGRIVKCGHQGHMELYPILYSVGLSSSSQWTDCDTTMHITCGQLSGNVPNEFKNWELYKDVSRFTQEQLNTLINNKSLVSFSSRRFSIMFYVLRYYLDVENHGGKYGNLSFIKNCFPEINLPKFGKSEIKGVKNCIRTSPTHSIAGLLNSKFDINENSIKEIEADWEKYKSVVGQRKFLTDNGPEIRDTNELFYFYQEFINGVNGVCHYRNDKFTYSCSTTQGDIVNGKKGDVTISFEQGDELRNFCKELYDQMGRQIQLEFVIEENTGKVFVVQFRMLEDNKEYRSYPITEENIIVKGKSFSMSSETLTIDEVLIVDEDCDSEKLIGKKGLIVRNDIEFSHVLALSYSMRIPSIYGVGEDFILPETFKIDTNGPEGYILKINK